MVQVGHLERFNPAVTAARRLLNRPMFFESHRLSVFTPRSLDVDVVLDLMIHDLDIVLSLVASPVREVRAVGLPVLSQKVDIANVRRGVRERLRGELHGQPGFDGAGAEAAVLPAASVSVARLCAAGSADDRRDGGGRDGPGEAGGDGCRCWRSRGSIPRRGSR